MTPECVKKYETKLFRRMWHQTVYKNMTPVECDTRLFRKMWHQTVYKNMTLDCCKPRDGPKGLTYKVKSFGPSRLLQLCRGGIISSRVFSSTKFYYLLFLSTMSEIVFIFPLPTFYRFVYIGTFFFPFSLIDLQISFYSS